MDEVDSQFMTVSAAASSFEMSAARDEGKSRLFRLLRLKKHKNALALVCVGYGAAVCVRLVSRERYSVWDRTTEPLFLSLRPVEN